MGHVCCSSHQPQGSELPLCKEVKRQLPDDHSYVTSPLDHLPVLSYDGHNNVSARVPYRTTCVARSSMLPSVMDPFLGGALCQSITNEAQWL